jgi:cation:H+ antiporter
MLETIIYIKLFSGFALLFMGGEALVRGAVSLARRLHVSPLLIGATVVAFGTSTPELVVSLGAALRGSIGIAFGNIIGSNIANLLLILGVGAVISPLVIDRRTVSRDGWVLAFATALLVLFSAFGAVEPWQGGLMLVVLIIITTFSYWHERRQHTAAGALHVREAEELHAIPHPVWLAGFFVLAGLASVAFGAHLLVSSAATIARGLGISESVIGLTIVAIGSSLPELATTIVAAYRKHTDVALGNVLGSNVFNILAIMGIVASVKRMEVPQEILAFDLWLMLGVTVMVIALVLTGSRLSRPLGILFLVGYAAFVTVQYLK